MQEKASTHVVTKKSIRPRRLIPAVVVLALAAAGAAWSAPQLGLGEHSHETWHALAAAVQKYTCPMHPEVIADTPGECPLCGMKLVPAKSGK